MTTTTASRPWRRLAGALLSLTLAACAGSSAVAPVLPAGPDGWAVAPAQTRETGLGMPGGTVMAPGVRFMGAVRVLAGPRSPLHSLSDLKLTGGGRFVTVSDVGDLVTGRVRLDRRGRLVGITDWRVRRLTDLDGSAIVEKERGDAEGLAFTGGDLLVSFERDHRIWSYGPLAALAARPTPMRLPDVPFATNDGIEGLAAAPEGWIAAGESGGVWRCSPATCRQVTAPPEPLLTDADYRITGMDRDPSDDGWFVVQRSYTPPVDARARVRRMAPDGTLGPVLVELKLPGLTDNFEGIAAEPRGEGVRLYILSDDNFNPAQRTFMVAFDVE